MTILRKIDKYFEEWITFVLFAFLILTIFLQVLFRYVLNLPLHWGEETARYTLVALVYFSAIVAVKRNKHLRTEGLVEMLPSKAKKWIKILSDIIWLTFTLLMVRFSFLTTMTIYASGQKSAILNVSMVYVYGIVPICFTLMSFRIMQQIIKKIKNNEDDNSIESMI